MWTSTLRLRSSSFSLGCLAAIPANVLSSEQIDAWENAPFSVSWAPSKYQVHFKRERFTRGKGSPARKSSYAIPKGSGLYTEQHAAGRLCVFIPGNTPAALCRAELGTPPDLPRRTAQARKTQKENTRGSQLSNRQLGDCISHDLKASDPVLVQWYFVFPPAGRNASFL